MDKEFIKFSMQYELIRLLHVAKLGFSYVATMDKFRAIGYFSALRDLKIISDDTYKRCHNLIYLICKKYNIY
ncbi:MAG: hypothetical protein E7257_01645 [Lachnospiraceae bacterium]|nr:hypothetical protein [Lachnospiraceae bacterium]